MTPLPPRADALRRAAALQFDVVVIGGGIVGAGVARDAARRGLRTMLLERDDFASGTSSRSSRLVHGGVRYLEHGWLNLVFEASRERRRLLDAAPHLVRPLRFTWPVYDQQRLARWEIGAGLLMYDVLALYRNVGKHKRMSRDAITEREPSLRVHALEGGATYWDAATDDARLTLVNALDAERAGAVVLNHAAVASLARIGPEVNRVMIRDGPSKLTVEVRTRCVVNATGPWTDSIRRMEDAAAPAALRGTKGVHLLVPRHRVGNSGALTLLHPRDQRVMFVLPDGPRTVIGTTDTRTDATPDTVRADTGDVFYLLESVNHFFPAANLVAGDVITAWAGIRPLIASNRDGDPASQSREHEIDVGPHGVISVSGGKLTTYRSMAEEIVDVVTDRLGIRGTRSDTARATLPGGDIADLAAEISAASDACGEEDVAESLVHSYGSAWRDVLSLAPQPDQRARVTPESTALRAGLLHAVRREHARTLSDLLIRRTHIAFETRDHGISVARDVAQLVAPELHWTADDVEHAVATYTADVERFFTVDPP